MTNPLNDRGGRQFPQRILDDIDARLNAVESKPAQSGEQDERAKPVGYMMKHKTGADTGFAWQHDDPLFSMDWERIPLYAASTQPVQTERALTEVGFIVHDDLHGWHFAPTVAWTYLGRGRSLYAMTDAQPASSLAEGDKQ